jgi:tyrosine-protein kinase Etk/Wzc
MPPQFPQQQHQQQQGLRQIDFGHYIRHYAGVLWRAKWYIIIAGPIAATIAFFAVLELQGKNPELSTTVLIGLENAPVTPFEMQSPGDDRAPLMRSKNFLRQIVNQLSLRLFLKDFARHELFDSVYVDSTAPEGAYHFITDKEQRSRYTLRYSNKRRGVKNRVVQTGKTAELSTIATAGMHLRFTDAFLRDPRDFQFSIVSMRLAVEAIHKNMSITSADPRRGVNHIEVSMVGRDYQLIAKTVNAIADAFVERNLSWRVRKTKRALEVLEKQLAGATSELETAEQKLQAFRSANPTVGLSATAQQAVTELAALESSDFNEVNVVREGQALVERYTQASGEIRLQIVGELLTYLSQNGSVAAPVLQNEYQRLMAQRQEIGGQLFENHPRVKENQDQLRNLGQRALAALRNFLSKVREQGQRRGATQNRLYGRLRGLPGKELTLAELERKRQVASEIHTAVLTRYNQAKLEQAVEVADVFVMDYAVPPIPPPVNMLQFLAIAMLAGLGAALGPVVFLDMIDKTARTEHDLRPMIKMPVLESIPIIKVQSPAPEARTPAEPGMRTPDDHLLSNPAMPDYVREMFRSLRAKVLLALHESSDKSLAVTSLDMDAGKSTLSANIAIAMAHQGFRTLLIDGDLRRGVLHNSFAVKKTPGLSEVLSERENLTADAAGAIVQPTGVENCFLVASGKNTAEAAELLSGARFQSLKQLLSAHFDMIVLDTPPLGVAVDAVTVHEQFSRYLLVARAGATNIIDLNKKLDEYPLMKKKIMGVVLNQASLDRKIKYYRYSEYYTARTG